MFKIAKYKLFLIIQILLFSQSGICQEINTNLELLNNDSLEIKFNDTLTQVRFKSLESKKFLNGRKKIVYENQSFSILKFIDGYPNGEWTMIDSLGNKISNTEYLNGRKNGEEIYYYPNGKTKLIATFVKGYQEGKTFMYYPSGILGGEFFCKRGKKHGIEKWFNDIDKKVIYKAYYLENKEVDSIHYFTQINLNN